MSVEKYIPLNQLCTHYQVEISFFTHLHEYGLIQVQTIEESHCIHQDHVAEVEKMLRMHKDLNLNFEGIDTVLNLLEKIDGLQTELSDLKNKLRLYED